MIHSTVKVGSATTSAWVPVESASEAGTEISMSVDITGTNTSKVQYTLDRLDCPFVGSISRSTTTATVTHDGTRIVQVGDTVIVEGAGSPFDTTTGVVASVPGATSFTYTVADSGLSAAHYCRFGIIKPYDHSTLTGLTASAVGNLAFPVTAVRLNVTAYTSGSAALTVLQNT